MCHTTEQRLINFIKHYLACLKTNKIRVETISHICTEHGMNRWNDTVLVISSYGVSKLLQKKKNITCTHQALVPQITHHDSLFIAAGV